MTCQLEIISEHRDIVGDDAVREFSEEGGTIGRSLQNDWILPDPDRYISGRHATIDFKGGIYYLVDTSSNGVYVNGDCEPIGKGNVRRLFNGDVLRFGDFEITVSIEHGESIVVPLDEAENHIAENVAPLVHEDSIATGMALLDEDEITGDDDFQAALFGAPADPGTVERAEQKVAEQSVEEMIEAPQHSVPRELAEADLVATDLIDSLLAGLGISRAELHPSVDLGEVMQNAGEVLREFVEGVSSLLASRANMKNAFRLDQTTVLPQHNNPLKLSANARDSIKQLLVGREGEYLGPRDAVREVCRDLLFHQDAMLDGMDDAFSEFADRFDPEELAETFDHDLDSNALVRWRNKSKYWQMYCDQYPIITKRGDNRFPQTYAEAFVAAYERQIAEYNRLGTFDEHLKATVIMNESDLMSHDATTHVAANDDDQDSAIDLKDAAELLPKELEKSPIEQSGEKSGRFEV